MIERSYDSIRSNIKTGDVILWKGTNVISRLIRLFTEYSHASLVVRLDHYYGLDDRIFLVEAVRTGLELRLLSEKMKKYHGDAYILNIDANDMQREAMLQFALIECAKGIPYDFRSVFLNMFCRFTSDIHKYFCSEFVWLAWLSGGVISNAFSNYRTPLPGDLPSWVTGKLNKISRCD